MHEQLDSGILIAVLVSPWVTHARVLWGLGHWHMDKLLYHSAVNMSVDACEAYTLKIFGERFNFLLIMNPRSTALNTPRS